MGDNLEDAFFKSNVPGQYSRWVDEKESREIDDKDDNELDADHIFESRNTVDANPWSEDNRVLAEKLLEDDSIPFDIRESIITERSRNHNTGVKGVLADARIQKKLELAKWEADKNNRNAILMRMATGKSSQTNDREIANAEPALLMEPSIEDNDDEFDDDESFMKEYRNARLMELKANSQLPFFNGQVLEIQQCELIKQVEGVDPRVFVLIHLYENGISSCVRMNRILEEIAPKRRHIKFLRMNCSSNGIEIDRVAMPILTVYRAGETINTIAGITLEFGEFFKVEDVEWLLDSNLV